MASVPHNVDLAQVSCARWRPAWPEPGLISLRSAAVEQRAAVLAAWAAEPSSRGDLKVWALTYWGECPLHKDLGETETEWRRGGAVLLTWQGEWGVLPWQPLARGDA